jgi:hypothetical protein
VDNRETAQTDEAYQRALRTIRERMQAENIPAEALPAAGRSTIRFYVSPEYRSRYYDVDGGSYWGDAPPYDNMEGPEAVPVQTR